MYENDQVPEHLADWQAAGPDNNFWAAAEKSAAENMVFSKNSVLKAIERLRNLLSMDEQFIETHRNIPDFETPERIRAFYGRRDMLLSDLLKRSGTQPPAEYEEQKALFLDLTSDPAKVEQLATQIYENDAIRTNQRKINEVRKGQL